MGRVKTTDDTAYRLLRRHLDRQAVGFPATRSGAEIRFLRRMFRPEEASLAMHISYRPTTMAEILESLGGGASEEEVRLLLDSMALRGAIGCRRKDGVDHWFLMPMVIGMYEAQDGKPTPDFLKDAGEYMSTLAYGKSLLETRPSQMRTIPVNASVSADHTVATYNQVKEILDASEGPFVLLPCICRETRAMQGKSCELTEREYTCFAMGSMARMVLRRGHGREVDREEALRTMEENVEEGMVLQPANAQKPEFICSCCGCCCGMLRMQKMLPHPVDFWTTDYRAEVDPGLCTGCGVCAERCQVDAVVVKGSPAKAVVNDTRCIGCGLCVTACPAGALRLVRREGEPPPPMDEEDLNDTIRANRRGRFGRFVMTLKVLLRMRQ